MRKFLGTYIFSIIIIISIAVVFDITERMDKFNKPSYFEIIFNYYVNFIPYYANLFSALFVFIAVIFFTSKLAENSEIIAILSNGMSFKRLLKPYMYSAAVIAIFSFYLSSFVIPPANVTRLKFENTYFRDKSVTAAQGLHMKVGKGSILYISHFYKEKKSADDEYRRGRGENVSLDHFEGKELKSRLIAKKIVYLHDTRWRLSDYFIRDFHKNRETLIQGKTIDTTLNVSPSDFLISVNDFEQMTTPTLYKYIKKEKDRGLVNVGGVSLIQFQIEFDKRMASFFSAFILTFIGVALSSKKIKGGMGLNIGIGLGLSFFYIMFMTISSTFAINGLMTPWLAVWLPNFIYIIIAVLFV